MGRAWGDHGKIMGKDMGNIWEIYKEHIGKYWKIMEQKIYIYGKRYGEIYGIIILLFGKMYHFFMNHQNAINMTFGSRKNQTIILQEK
jgi:hypothetical protein